MTHILYRSDRLEVRQIAAGDGRRQVITFDSYHEPPGLDRPGFGEDFFRNEGITAIHVMSHGNDWFQYTEMQSVLSVIRTASADAAYRLTYGSSMGGYAALRFAAAVGAQAALALSPQYSVDRRKAPFETRWAADRRRIRFVPAFEGAIAQVPLMVLAYDCRVDADRKHAALLAGEADMLQIPLPFAGHPVGPFLQDVGLLRPLVLGMFDGTPDADHVRATARARRESSPHWLASAAEHDPDAQGDHGIALARRAVALAPDRPSLHDMLARRLAAAGRYREALEAHHAATAIEPITDYQWGLSKTFHAAGDVVNALRVAEQLQRLAPSTAGYHAWASHLNEALGQLPRAIADMRRALDHDRANAGYRYRLFRLRLLRLRRALFRR